MTHKKGTAVKVFVEDLTNFMDCWDIQFSDTLMIDTRPPAIHSAKK